MVEIAKQPRVGEHPVHRTLTNTRNRTPEPGHNFIPPDEGKQTHPLMRRIEDRRIAPGQLPQIPVVNLEILSGPPKVAETPAQSPRRRLVAHMRQRCRPLRKCRHHQSTAGAGRREIRLVAGIGNRFGLPRTSPPRHTKLA